MAKILLFTDNHFCETSSIVRKIGTKYSVRLENQIQSINWLEQKAIEENCNAVICLGDFFDKPTLTDNELTALQDIKWNNLPHYFLVGNHESEEVDLCFNSTKALESGNHFVISEPYVFNFDNRLFKFLPYTVERNRKPIEEYFKDYPKSKTVILSHNDIKGMQLGPVETKTGFSIEDIKDNCSLFINGHLHNGTEVAKNIINLGNLTGQDFKEEASKYKHNIMILDTDNLHYELIENPYALRFYNIEINNIDQLKKLDISQNNAVISVKCIDSLVAQANELINNNQNIIASRIMTIKTAVAGVQTEDLVELGISNDYLTKLIEFSHEKLEHSAILDYELAEICK